MSKRFVVIGAGVAGLAAARALRRGAPGAEVVLLERDARVGGLVVTETTMDGLVLEHGADSILEGQPAGMRELAETGISDELLRAPAGTRRSYVARGGKLLPLPAGIVSGRASVAAMMSAPLFSWKGRARMTLEPLVPTRTDSSDETVASFFGRRFGSEMVERLIEPVFRAVYAIPASELSMRAVAPHLALLEQEHGSLARAMAHRASVSRIGTSVSPTPVSVRRGMGSLPTALARGLTDSIRLGVSVTKLRRTARGFSLALGAHGELEADGIVVATPAPAAARLLGALDRALGDALGGIRLGRLDTVTFAYRAKDIPCSLDGTGFVVDAHEQRALTACAWSSSKWAHRAPDGIALLRCFLSAADATDDELVAAARAELRALMGIEVEPVFTRVYRRSEALPRYELGYLDRAAATLERVMHVPGLAVAGNAYSGMSIPDCLASGLTAAARLLAEDRAYS
jgi:oxygen-dependent protoporphyrinogen oxidase